MAIEDYRKAQKKAEHVYKEALSKGEYPYLQVLDEILSHESTGTEVKLGLKELPLDSIAGTRTAGRRNAFAKNFMPLLSEDTEFAVKWSRLADAHITEGIQTPIKAYEYLHRFYVMEGNKRVSVLKYYDAVSVSANVTRIIPVQDGSKRHEVYFEYLKFYRYCPVLFLEFTELGAYDRFTEIAGKEPEEYWNDEEVNDLRYVYFQFLKAYRQLGGEELHHITASDALLTYMRFYGYENTMKTMEFKPSLEKIWDEVVMLSKKESVDLVMEPEAAPKRSLFGRFFGENPERKLQIAFIFHRDPSVSTWAYGHELGRQQLQEKFGKQLTIKTYRDVTLATISDTLDTAIKEGADIIFSTTEIFMGACNLAAAMNPKVRILSCGVNVAQAYISTYSARIYEAKFLSGLIAGSLTENGKVGYLADNPSYGNIATANAFALGVEAVNPNAKVYVQWAAKKDADPNQYFKDNDVKLISGRDILGTNENKREYGLYRTTENGIQNIAIAILNWGVFYEKLVKSILNGAFDETERNSAGRAVNYWWGFGADVIDLIMSPLVPPSTAKLVRFLEKEIKGNAFHLFYGQLYSQDGPVVREGDYAYSPMEIATMNWLNGNIIGEVPKTEDLKPAAQALMKIQEDTKEKA